MNECDQFHINSLETQECNFNKKCALFFNGLASEVISYIITIIFFGEETSEALVLGFYLLVASQHILV